jgi:hypothetical protein
VPIFSPPVVFDNPPVLPETRGIQRALFRHFGPYPRGRSVVYRAGHYVIVDTPPNEELLTLTEGVTYFLGGHVYTVDDDIAALLEADGFDLNVDYTTWGELAGALWGEAPPTWELFVGAAWSTVGTDWGDLTATNWGDF